MSSTVGREKLILLPSLRFHLGALILVGYVRWDARSDQFSSFCQTIIFDSLQIAPWRDDHPDNIQATHFWCNEEKGSTRIDDC
jgi:hypothetical protein